MTELGTFLLPAVPLLALLAFLLLGRYPGADAIVRLADRFSGAPDHRRRGGERTPLPRSPRSFAPGGGLLIALALAQRPPPTPA